MQSKYSVSEIGWYGFIRRWSYVEFKIILINNEDGLEYADRNRTTPVFSLAYSGVFVSVV